MIGIPCAGLFEHFSIDAEIHQLTRFRDPLREENVELRLFEGRRHLVFDHLHADTTADDFLPLFDGFDPADIQADRRVELECIAAGGRLGIAEHYAELHADLIDKNDRRLRF